MLFAFHPWNRAKELLRRKGPLSMLPRLELRQPQPAAPVGGRGRPERPGDRRERSERTVAILAQAVSVMFIDLRSGPPWSR